MILIINGLYTRVARFGQRTAAGHVLRGVMATTARNTSEKDAFVLHPVTFVAFGLRPFLRQSGDATPTVP